LIILILSLTSICLAILQGHTSLVGQLQLRGGTLVTGGSDGIAYLWSLHAIAPICRISAADNSITCLQFDHRRIVTGSSDGKVKVWDIKTGELVRELGSPSDAVWRLHISESMAVIIRSRIGKTLLEVMAPLHHAPGKSADGY
jgi:F-box and WD-40 domain protein CDC4